MEKLKITVTSAFGIEGLLRKELNKLGYTENLIVEKGKNHKEGYFDDGTGARTLRRGLKDAICRDAQSWTVEVRVRLPPAAREAGRVLGNVCRWRVGDRRHPEKERVSGSRYEHTRLDTRFTQPNDDPAAFVDFLLR